MPGDTISLNRLELLRFYDNPSASERGIHAAAVNAVAGEEFGLALVLDFLNASGVDASIIPGPCTTGSRKGHRLDGWVRTPDVLYQVEIKNWSAHSFGGTNLAINADPEELARYRTKLWGEYWSGSTFTDTAAQKVLEPMRPPASRPQVEPLIAFWPSMHPEGLATPLFQVPLIGGHFNRVSVFSMSSYLRGMDREHLELPLPKTMARLAILARMFEPVDAFRV
jgi:hypothetical protein